MARKKDSQALFEVISRNKDKHVQPKFGIPDWMTRDRKAKPDADAPPPPAEEGEDVREPAAPTPPAAPPKPVAPKPVAPPTPTPPRPVMKPLPKPPPKPTPAAKASHGKAEPVFGFDGEQIRLRVSILTAGVSAIGLLIVLLGTFWLGRTTAPRTPASEAEVAQPKPATPKGGGQSPRGSGSNGGRNGGGIVTPPKLIAGRYYLVIQSLQGLTPSKLADASKIVKFCADNGVPAMVMRTRTSYHVWSLKPFEHAETLNAVGTRYAAQIEALGQKYQASGGRYSFRQRNRSGAVEGWFLKHSEN